MKRNKNAWNIELSLQSLNIEVGGIVQFFSCIFVKCGVSSKGCRDDG